MSATATDETVQRSGSSRVLHILLVCAALVIALLGLRQVGSFVGPVFLGLNLMLVAAPLFSRLARAGVPRVLAAITSVLAVYVFLIVFLGALCGRSRCW